MGELGDGPGDSGIITLLLLVLLLLILLLFKMWGLVRLKGDTYLLVGEGRREESSGMAPHNISLLGPTISIKV